MNSRAVEVVELVLDARGLEAFHLELQRLPWGSCALSVMRVARMTLPV